MVQPEGWGLRLPGSPGRPAPESEPGSAGAGHQPQLHKQLFENQRQGRCFGLQISVALGDLYTPTYYEVKILRTFGVHRERITI